jgi:DedD protein
MTGSTKTRTQRRMEKRQAIILLVLVLAVALASFTLGVIVGDRGAERDFAQKMSQTEKVLVAQAPAEATVPIVEVNKKEEVGEKTTEQVAEDPKLTFYDNVAKDTAPLGSGINLAPVEDAPAKEAVALPPIDLPEQPIVVQKKETVNSTSVSQLAANVVEETKVEAPARSVAAMPNVASGGSHAVQIGSFNSAGDAIALKKKMLKKEYPAFVVEADLGKKGLWYRVRIGPYANTAKAKQAQSVLEQKEKIKGFVSKQ